VAFGFSPLESSKVLILSISRCAGFFCPIIFKGQKGQTNKKKEKEKEKKKSEWH
jgi:hypothetical protein